MDYKIFQKLREIVYKNCGINLNDSKVAMVSARIGKRMRVLNIKEHTEYLDYLINDKNSDEITNFLDVISTNVTSFFREKEHFDLLNNIIMGIVKSGQKRIRIWCAAASTGQEPYTIAMVCDRAGAKSADLKILATDISTKVLVEAKEGKYNVEKIKKVPSDFLVQYFTEEIDGNNKFYCVKEVLKKLIVFKRLNLFQTPYPMRGPIDVVYCRNVMIYFDNSTREKLISEIYRLLKPGGYLITGHAESLTSIKNNFKCIKPSIFIK
jgi:chemotaxis protein methyltransferase CheR